MTTLSPSCMGAGRDVFPSPNHIMLFDREQGEDCELHSDIISEELSNVKEAA